MDMTLPEIHGADPWWKPRVLLYGAIREPRDMARGFVMVDLGGEDPEFAVWLVCERNGAYLVSEGDYCDTYERALELFTYRLAQENAKR